MAQLAKLVSQYGKVAVGVHTCYSVTFLSAAWTGVHYGMDISAVAAYLPVEMPVSAGGGGEFAAEAAVSYAIYKATAPVRWPLTGATTAAIVKYTDV